LKIAIVTDTHYGARGDSVHFSNYFAKFYNDIFFPYLEKNNIRTVIHLGDVFDRRKFINFASLKSCREYFFNKLNEQKIDTHIIAGNHDTFYKNTNEVNALGLLLKEYKNIHTYDEPAELTFDGTTILVMPWICSGNYNKCMKTIEQTNAQILFGHLEISGFEMHRGTVNDGGFDAGIFNKFDLVCSGHFHHKSTRGNINYLGTPYEIAWPDYNDQKGFHIFDTDTRELEFIHNPYCMFRKIYYDDLNKNMSEVIVDDFTTYADTYVKVVVRNKTVPLWFDMFIEKLEKAGVLDMQVVDDHLNLYLEDDSDIVNQAEDTLTILNKYVEQMNEEINKQRLEGLLRNLYNEAVSLEYTTL
jgi:DNA repair exonuclease SbcCD nuclease subunit